MTVRMLAIDGNGKQVSHEVINVSHLNKSDSLQRLLAARYRYARHIFGMEQTMAEVKPGGDAGKNNAAGFTFLSFRESNELATISLFTEDGSAGKPIGGVKRRWVFAVQLTAIDDYIAESAGEWSGAASLVNTTALLRSEATTTAAVEWAALEQR